MSTENLIGFTYSDVLHRTITVVSEDPIKGPGYYLVERDDGARWGVEAWLLKRLFRQLLPPERASKESENAQA